MGERYEIKGKIGQGGLGAVYKAYDMRMSRDVAIKRIVANPNDNSISEEATRQLIKEAGALSALQHPNIVTIYDVGTDEDGPFVVMELLAGQTLEDIVLQGSFTWPDFRQFAMQTLEALIAAQELNLVHRDLKPTNIMVTWLPSGKFQVKIVDFGLAKLSAAPTLQTVDQHDGVFGSIYFMAPEQFERVPISAKADIYAIGCVFYYALTGTFPFDGDTAATVMASHLQHHVTPLQEVREGIPLWACDWVMWHINRYPDDRPESARQALQFFLDNDTLQTNPELSTGLPTPAIEQPKRPKLVIPGAAPTPEVITESVSNQPTKTASIPKPILPPDGSKPSVHTTAQVTQSSPVEPTISEEPTPAPVAQISTHNKAVPAVAAVQVDSMAAAVPQTSPTQPAALAPKITPTAPKLAAAPPKLTPTSLKSTITPTASLSKSPIPSQETHEDVPAPQHLLPAKKKSLPPIAKTFIAVGLGIFVIAAAMIFIKKSGDNAETKLYNEMIALAAKNEEIPVTKHKLDILLRTATDVASNNDRNNVYHALVLAKSADGTDVDGTIATFATTKELVPNIRVILIRDVLRMRKNPSVIPQLLTFTNKTSDPQAAIASIEAIRFMVTDTHTSDFISIIQNNPNEQIRRAAEENLANIISKSKQPDKIAESIFSSYGTASNDAIRHTFLRLMGRIGGDKALAIAKENLSSEKETDKFAAIAALSTWKGNDGLPVLMDFFSTETNLQIRARAFNAAISFNEQSASNQELNWSLLESKAKTQDELKTLISALAGKAPAEPWNTALLQKIASTSKNEEIVDYAEKAINHVADRRAVQGEE